VLLLRACRPLAIPIRGPYRRVHGRGNGVVNVELQRGGGTNGDYSRPEFNADCDIVVRREAAFAEADGQARLAAAAVTEGDDFGDVIPWLLGHEEACGSRPPEARRRRDTNMRFLPAVFGIPGICWKCHARIWEVVVLREYGMRWTPKRKGRDKATTTVQQKDGNPEQRGYTKTSQGISEEQRC